MNKKIFYLSIGLLMGLSLLTGCKNEMPKTPSASETIYSIGDSVTLKDGSTWYVIENSDSSKDTITLFASQNIKNDASGWTTIQNEYKIAFDEAGARTTEKNTYCKDPGYGCNIYAAQSGTITNGNFNGTVTEDSTIKKFIDSKVLPHINNSLKSSGGTAINSIRLITVDEICNIINASNSSNNCTLTTAKYVLNGNKSIQELFTNVPTWLYSTSYWTMTLPTTNHAGVYYVDTSSKLNGNNAYYYDEYGVRPVIVTNKSNIK